MKKLIIKKGDTVKVIAGEGIGMEGEVLQILRDKDRAIVEGVNMVSKHKKPSTEKPQGEIVKKEASIHISNISLVEGGVATRVGYRMEGDKKVRFSKKSNNAI